MSEPLIYTSKGNLPIDSLQYATRWEKTDDYVKLVETYRLDGEVVRESAHVLGLSTIELVPEQFDMKAPQHG